MTRSPTVTPGPGVPSATPGGRAAAIRCLALDDVAVRTHTALAAHGIHSVLIKGPALSRRLYPRQPALRRYADVDLLVAPGDFAAAEQRLAALGYRSGLPGSRSSDWVLWHERPWVAPGPLGLTVDLHRGFCGVGDPDAFWQAVSASAEYLPLAGGVVPVPGDACTALLIGLHAAAPGGSNKPYADLARALTVLPATTWRAAAAVAELAGASAAFAAGLRLSAQGTAVAAALGLPERTSTTQWLVSHRRSPAAVTLARIGELPTYRQRLGYAWARLVPSPQYLRHLSPLARRGRAGLLAAYLLRAGRCVGQLPRGVRDLHAARRRVRG